MFVDKKERLNSGGLTYKASLSNFGKDNTFSKDVISRHTVKKTQEYLAGNFPTF